MDSKTVAILGASTNRSKFGNKAVRAYHAQGFTVYPVNPNADTVEGLQAYASLDDVPGPLSQISVYLPPPVTLGVLESIAHKNPEMVFFNPGSEDETVMAKASELGIPSVQACSIIAAGRTPGEFGSD